MILKLWDSCSKYKLSTYFPKAKILQCALYMIDVDKCNAEVAGFLQRWIVDILENRFNRIYSDPSIHAIKHLCSHIDFLPLHRKQVASMLSSFRS